MPTSLFMSSPVGARLLSAARLLLASGSVLAAVPAAMAKQAIDLAGVWDLFQDGTRMSCRVILQPQRSDKGNYFLGMPAACRHAMPAIEKVGRWSLSDDGHLGLDDPAGNHVLTFEPVGESYVVDAADGAYTLRPTGGAGLAEGRETEIDPQSAPSSRDASKVAAMSVSRETPQVRLTAAQVAGRYAVLREKRDTGCMITLDDSTRAKVGGERAQLAPGCRDQGIVIFDPAGWQLVKGALVLTARAGHKTHLDLKDDGTWQKDPKDGKPLGLKKL